MTLKQLGFRIVDNDKYALFQPSGTYFVEASQYCWTAWHEDMNGEQDLHCETGASGEEAFEKLARQAVEEWQKKVFEANCFLMDIYYEKQLAAR